MKKDSIVGLVCLIGTLLLYSTLGSIEDPRATIFPRTIIIFMGIFSFLLIVQDLVLKKEKDKGDAKRYPWFRFLALFVIIVVYLAVSEWLGFFLSAFLLFVTVTCVLGETKPTVKKAGFKALGAAIFTGILFLLFGVILEVQTPRGLLF